MKTGIEQLIENASYTSSVTPNVGFEAENILDPDSLHLWQMTQGAGTLVIEHDSITADILCLFNCNIETNVTIKTWTVYSTGSITNTVVLTPSDYTGFEFDNLLAELTDTTTAFTAIELIFTGATSSFLTSVGYLWGGDLINFGCAEKVQSGDESADDIQITRSNRPDPNERYNFQTYDVTLKKENDYDTLRSNMRQILTTGYGTSRPYIMNEPFLLTQELLLGILDSGKIKYDIIELAGVDSGGYIAQTTIGIREVT
jgi:hypothetical protein